MDTQLKNLFPEALKKRAMEIYREPAIWPVLLRLVSAHTPAEQLQSAVIGLELLHPKEATIFNGYALAKRRAEYLTGRICAKMAIRTHLTETKNHRGPLALTEIEIANNKNGRPTVHIERQKCSELKMDISISHSGEYGLAIAAEPKCGIDIQQQHATLLRVQDKYCNKAEYSLLETSLPDYNTLARLTILWTAKEAAKKALSYWQMPGFLDLQLRLLDNFPDCIALSLQITNAKYQQLPHELTVVADIFEDYALAICLVREESGNARTP